MYFLSWGLLITVHTVPLHPYFQYLQTNDVIAFTPEHQCLQLAFFHFSRCFSLSERLVSLSVSLFSFKSMRENKTKAKTQSEALFSGSKQMKHTTVGAPHTECQSCFQTTHFTITLNHFSKSQFFNHIKRFCKLEGQGI